MGTAGRGRPSRFSKSGSAVSALGKTILSRGLPSLLAALLCSVVPALAETPGGTRIANTATVTSGSALFSSNTVTIMVRSTATIEFLKYAPRPESGGAAVPVAETSYRTGSGGFVAIPQPPPTLNPAVPLLGSANGVPINYYLGETIYLRLTDLDQNLDPAKTEFILLTVTCRETGDTETLRLSETGPDTGIFTGYLPTTLDGGSGADGRLLIQDNCQFSASYVDSADGTDTSVSAALVDPYGIVFDSLTGAPLDGATVTLFNVGTNSPAIVFADDGVSPYPATITTGDPAYSLPNGGFRFPYIVPGNYRLMVRAPAGYGVPSTADESQLLTVRPDAVLVAGSRGEDFAVDPGPALRIDIPADPLLSYLWLQKTVGDEQATVGDFLQYRLELENTNDAVAAPTVTIGDQLPLGFRYQNGSTRIAGTRSADPTISGDGRTLTFQVGDIPPKGRVVVTYVAEVAAGAKPGVATNTAQAIDGNSTASNQAKAAVTVREQFFRDKVFLLGRVLSGDCSESDAEMSGLGGVRIYLEDGSYVVTDKAGKYHFEGIDPGVHVVQLDLDSLPAGYEARPCQVDNHFAGRTFSQFVDLQGGTPWQANFYVAPKPLPTGQISFSLEGHVAGTTVLYRLPIEIRDVAVANLQALLVLPPGTGNLPGSTRINGLAAADPLSVDGALAIPLGQLPPGSHHLIELTVNDQGGNSGELLAKAVLTFDLPGNPGQRTPQAENRIIREATETRFHLPEIIFSPRYPTFVAELSDADLDQLKNIATTLDGKTIIRIDAVGHADDVPIAAGSQHIHPDNQALSEARATNVVRALGEMLHLPPSKVTISGRGDREPLSRDKTADSRALNRRVELHVVAEEISSDIRLSPAPPAPSVEMTLTPRQLSPSETAPLKAEPEAVPQPGIKTPADGSRIVDQVMQVQTALDARLTPRLTLDGKEIPGERIGFRRTNQQANLTSYNYVGVDFGEPGTHELILEGIDPFGNVRFSATSKVVRTGKIKRIQQIPGPENIADGVTPVTIRLRIEDLAGDQVAAPLKMQLTNGSLAPWNPKNANLRTPDDPDRNLIEVDQDGFARFAATTHAGRHTATLIYGDIEVKAETWLKPKMRDWILVGFAEGTVGYNTISNNTVSADEAGIDEHGYTDGRVKFFAKGAIKGEWLLTLAYDSDKPDLDGDSLQQIIDPDTYYPLYGDETQQGYEAASARDIYVKLERDQFYALFGDMQTGLTQTVLSQYSRGMNGFKSELQGERFAYTVFAADTRQAFVKDELRGDGTSGRYPLSQKDLVINSEEVVIETRDRFHNERIVKEERMSRHVDYDIDYDAGTLWFKRPVPSKDENFNPVFIVVRYETAASNQANLNYGGRGAVKLLDGQVEVGASLIHEDNGVAEGDLYGADVTVQLTPQTTLRAEVAATDVEEIDDDRKGDAYLAEIEHRGERLDGRA